MKTTLRWIAVLPAAIGAYFAASAAVALFNLISTFISSIGWSKGFMELIQTSMAGAAFVWYGSRVAPSHRFVTALSLAAIHLCAFTVLATFVVLRIYWKDWETAWQAVCAIGGIAGTFVAVCEAYRRERADRRMDLQRATAAPIKSLENN